MPVSERVALLRKVADGINARFEEFLAAEIRDTGKPRSIASHIDIPRRGNFNVFADQILTASTESFEMATPDGAGALNYALRLPRGVIAVVCPWNLPLLLMTWKVAPALACGNTVVVKPSEETPATATLLGEVMNAAGIPGVSITSSTEQGRSRRRVSDEPSGCRRHHLHRRDTHRRGDHARCRRRHSPGIAGAWRQNAGIIFDDADLDATLEGIGRACFANTGQVCLGTERLYVQRGIFERLAEGLARKAGSYRFGDPFDPATTMGPLISAEHRQKVLSYYEKAKAEGATILAGGGVPDLQGYEAGYWVEPTVWTGLPQHAPVITDEIFGPCTHITPSIPKKKASLWQMTVLTGWPPPSGRRTCRARTAFRGRSRWALPGSIAGSCATSEPLWRLESLRHRPRRRNPFPRILYRAAQRLHQTLKGS